MNGHSTTSSYSDRLEAFRQSDAERDALCAEVIRKYEDLQLKYAEVVDDYKNEIESRRLWQSKANTHERALAEHKQNSVSNSFVLVVIDGDGAIFQDYLWSMGRDGGAEAAHQLHAAIKTNLKETYLDGNVDDWTVVVQVVLNLQGLANKLQACGIIMNPNEAFAFGRAFGLAQPLFSFIDAGMGKERADHKIRETLRLFLPNAQCKHVFFGPLNDNGYLPVLERYKRDYASRLTLIETRPAEPGFASLCLKTVRFPNIFRSDNLPNKPAPIASPTPVAPPYTPMRTTSGLQMQPNSVPFVPQIPPPPQASQSASPAPSSDSSASTTWATVGKAGATVKSFNVASKKVPQRRYILLNVDDERLDMELPKSDPGAEKRFGDRLKADGKFCNAFHVSGKCEAGEYCDYNHGERLTPGEQLVLKHKARSRSCPKKYMCRDLDCNFGHVCKFGKSCFLNDCWFGDSHGMDTLPAKKMYENGTEEWIPAYLQSLK